jgi:hypothetical protein
MCNGLNHYRHCKCGFGNDGFLSFDSSYTSSEVKSLAENFFKYSAGKLTVPNFLCKCGKRVFFFQDSNGGKVLFESLGPPWEKHFCLGWQYQKRIQDLQIDPIKWIQIGHFMVTPSVSGDVSTIQGIVKDFLVTMKLDMSDLLIIRGVYMDAARYKKNQTNLEGLVVYEDGNYSIEQIEILKVEPFIMKDVGSKKPLETSKNFDLFD